MLNLIASALNRNDEAPNIELAVSLSSKKDVSDISEIVSGLAMDKATANDCIKVLYEIGARDANLLCPHADIFLDLLKSKNNRLVWGAMTALGQITALCPEKVFGRFDAVYAAFKAGSVITVDNSMSVFAALCAVSPAYAQKILPVLIGHFETCGAKEIPQHLERISGCLTPDTAKQFQLLIHGRYSEMTPSQQARVNKVFKKICG